MGSHNILMVDQLWLWTTQLGGSGQPTNPDDFVTGNFPYPYKEPDFWATRPQGQEHQAPVPLVITAFPDRKGAHSDSASHDDLRSLILDPYLGGLVNRDLKIGDAGMRNTIMNAQDLISRVLEICLGVFNKSESQESLRFIHMFEESIFFIVST
jgi:hypothetical protein